MMTELSLNVLDVAENSIRANATLIEISVRINTKEDSLLIIIKDNGCGMTEQQIAQVEDPFFTTRTTRKVGLGIPFFRYSALSTNGDFNIQSTLNQGTTVTASYQLSHIDRMPLGDMPSTIHTLITFHTSIDFCYTYQYNDNQFCLDTREFREILGDVPFDAPEVSAYIKSFLIENEAEANEGHVI